MKKTITYLLFMLLLIDAKSQQNTKLFSSHLDKAENVKAVDIDHGFRGQITELSKNARIVTPEIGASILKFEQGLESPTAEISFLSNAFSENLKTGDVVVSGSVKAAPYGFLQKITSLRKADGLIIVQTKQAALTEVVQNGYMDTDIEITHEMISKGLSKVASVCGYYRSKNHSNYTKTK